MSAMSSESHQPADAPRHPAAPEPAPGPADFGANEWLVEELYQRYLADPGSVDRAWWSFFADYTPALANGTGPQSVITAAPQNRAPAPSQNLAPAPSQVPQPPAAPPAQAAPTAPAQQAAPAPQPAQAPAAPAAPAAAQAPAAPAAPAPQAAPAQAPAPQAAAPSAPPAGPGTEVSRLRGAAARTVTNM